MDEETVLPSLPLLSTVATLPPPNVSERHATARLPIELWREIFVCATHVVRGYDTSYMSPFQVSEISDGYAVFLKRLKEAHRTKQALSIVSRTWRALAHELIFEYLFLQDSYGWSSLADALEESKRKDQSRGGHGVGGYVKRIEVNTACWTQELGVAAARVIRFCPNLRVLAVGATDERGGVPLEIIEAVFECCPRIRSLDWAFDIGPDQTTEMFCLISKAAKLQSLFMCVQQDIGLKHVERLEGAGRVSLPELHTLELVSPDFDPSVVLMVMATWNLPCLRQVVICGQTELNNAHHFFDAHGHKLSTLEFDYAGESEQNLISSSALPQNGPEMLFTRCPNLKELILQVHWAAAQAHHGHPNIERIGLRGLLFHQPRSRGGGLALRPEHDAEQRTVLHSLQSALPIVTDRTRFPSVQAVRLMDFEQSRFRSIPWRASGVAFWALWVKRFERLCIRLEDHAGDPIELVFREVNVLLPEDEQPGIICS